MRAKILIAAGFAVLVAALMWWLLGSLSRTPDELVVQVREGEFELRVRASGKLESGNALSVEARARGTILTYLAPEGKRVKKGEVLARFDETALRERVLVRRYDLRLAEARLAEKVQRKIVRERENAAEITMNRADLAIKRTQFKRLQSLPHPDDVTRSQLERDYRASHLKIAEQDLRNILSLMGRNAKIFSKEERREKELAHIEARAEFDKAQNDLHRVKEGASKAELEAALGDLNKAKIDLKRAIDGEPLKEKMLGAEIVSASAEVEKRKARLDRSQKKLDKLEVKSPGEGMLVYRTIFGRPLEVGTQFWHRAQLFDIADLDKMVVRAKVSESEFARIREGQSAEIRVMSVPGRTFTGRVIEVAKVAKDKSEDSLKRWGTNNEKAGIQAFDVLISINESNVYLRPNVEAEVVISCEKIPDALSIPIDAVTREKGHDFVLIRKGSRQERREVTLGVRGGDWVLVTDGVEAGEKVVLRAPKAGGGGR